MLAWLWLSLLLSKYKSLLVKVKLCFRKFRAFSWHLNRLVVSILCELPDSVLPNKAKILLLDKFFKIVILAVLHTTKIDTIGKV